ncbi:MAG TPA: metallophosphoesterase family protein [Peptococcaceae bacterium]|nr:metallophosphoesterase family protein [Peptococcaceae bacterium]
MKIGILSDTHIRKGRTLASFVWGELEDVDYILHAGDLVTPSLLNDLALLAPVVAVQGNCDWGVDHLPEKVITTFGNINVGLTHGYLGSGWSTPERAFNTFQGDQVDIIIFGHSHIPYKSFKDGVLLFNPGSPTEKRGQPHYSLGIMTIEDGFFDIQHIFF